jgi:hypothetical protein
MIGRYQTKGQTMPPPAAIDVRIVPATNDSRRGCSVEWGHPKRRYRQAVFFDTRTSAERFAVGLRAGRHAHALLLEVWGLERPHTLSDLGRKGAAARAASMTPERRREISQKGTDTRWAKRRGEMAAEEARLAGSVTDAEISELWRIAIETNDTPTATLCARALNELEDPDALPNVTPTAARAKCARILDQVRAAEAVIGKAGQA